MEKPLLVIVVVVFLKFLLMQEIIVTRVNDSLSQMSTNVTTLYELLVKWLKNQHADKRI